MKKIVRTIFASSIALSLACGVASAAGHTELSSLGNALFKDTNLSKNKNLSCMTCHHPSAGFEDPVNRMDPVNFPVSEGSIPGLFGGRNSPTAAYSGFSPVFYYDGANYNGGMFWDGRATGSRLGDPIAEQALGPFQNPVEMALSSNAEVVGIVEVSDYADKFEKVFGPDAFADVDEAYDNIGRAIAAYERSNQLQKFNSKFDKFWDEQGGDVSSFGVNGNGQYNLPAGFKSNVFTTQQAQGLALFNAVDKGNCAACHFTNNHVDDVVNVTYPPLFTDFTYDNLGIPVNPQIAILAGAQAIDYGLGARTAELLEAKGSEVSLVSVTSGTTDGGDVLVEETEAGKFKVPTLRNVERTAPYGHNGYFVTLSDVTSFFNTRDTADWEAPEVAMNVNTDELGDLDLTLEEEAAIVAFMETLTD